ncbi:MAG TPA: TadE/TadG family type IV pilus assembly protein [Acetobacteraceae bacterium]|jgi:Flp pilus assembly protein TadG|nr:TadE/TadG family type IV pilus assembly protein [Acetobacteraceae bacterium]
MTRRSFRALFADRRAGHAVEFGLIALPLMMLALGTIEFGRLIWTREALQMTATQGARCMGVLATSCSDAASTPPTNTISYIESVASGWGITLTSSNLTLTANATTGACSGLSQTVSQVSISYTFTTAVPGLLTMLSGGEALTAQACFPNQS